MKKTQCPKCKGKGCSHCGGKGFHTGASEGGMMNKKPMNPGIKALKEKAPAVAKKMGYKHGGAAKKKMGYSKGGMAKCGASYKG